MSSRYEIRIEALLGQAFKATVGAAQESLTRVGQAVKTLDKSASFLTGTISKLIGAYVGFQGLKSVADIMKAAERAAFDMASAVQAANKDFADIGGVSQWEAAVQRLSDRLLVYSNTTLKGAVASTIDMTKHLGLSGTQMEELIARVGDLDAGQGNLPQVLDKVTAALRGQAKGVAKMGILLDDNFVKAWYEANNAMGKAWDTLTENEKVQIRLAKLLVDTDSKLGSAADSAKTFSGAMALVKKEITDAIVENKNATEAMNDLARVLRNNAGEIGRAVSGIVSFISVIVQWAIRFKEVLAVLAKGAGLIWALGMLVKAVRTTQDVLKGLDAALKKLTNKDFSSWLTQLHGGFDKLKTKILASRLATIGLSAAIVTMATVAVVGAVKAFLEMRDAQKQAAEAAANAQKTIDGVKAKYEQFKDVKLPGDITSLAQEDLKKFQEQLYGARAYYRSLLIELEQKAKEKTIFGNYTEDAIAAQKEMAGVKARLGEINADIKRLEGQKGFEKPKEAIMATKEELKKFKATAQEAYRSAQSEAEDYAKKIDKLNQDIAGRQISREDKIRDLKRKSMTDEKAAYDLKRQAQQRELAAYMALEAFKSSGSENDKKRLEALAKSAETAWTSYADSGKNATSTAIRGLTRVNDMLTRADKEEIDTFAKMKEDAEKAMGDILGMIKRINQTELINIPIELKDLAAAQNQINALVKDETKHITIKVTEEHGIGGRVGMAAGGRFPGDSIRDSIPVMARPGEGFVRNEALSVWDRLFGKGFFEGINAPWSGAGQAIIRALSGQIHLPAMPATRPAFAFAAGGRVGDGLRDMGTVKIAVGDRAYPVMGRQDVVAELKQALAREQSRRSNQ